MDNLLEEEEIYWKQRLREEWLKWGDKNSKWFHKKANLRRKKNEITGILGLNGEWTKDPLLIEETFINYFENLFCSFHPDQNQIDLALDSLHPKIDKFMNVKLLAPFTKNDIEKAVSQMFSTKAPGPDGFPATFFPEILAHSG